MKFLTKINRNYFFLLLISMIIVSVAGYFILQFIILEDAKEALVQNEAQIIKQILDTNELPNIYPIVEITRINRKTNEKPSFKEVMMPYDGEQEVFLEYSDQVEIKNSYYQIKLREIIFENEDLISALVTSLLILLLSASGIFFFVSRRMNKTIWANFERDLFKIENFRISENQKLDLTQSDIEEFDRLNRVIIQLTDKLQTDFRSLKEFTENASHEIQTPISVVLLNLEEVLQQNLNEETFTKVVSSINAVKRLSNLNKSLILLTKIENDQFKADKLISFQNLFKQKIEEFSVLFESKNLCAKITVEHDFGVKMNDQLAEVLINNLLSNAVNHNISGGIIEIFMNEKELRISNTGEGHFLNDENIFNRFVKGNPKSYGLGLSIVKKICESNHMDIRYEKNELHCFTIKHVL